MRLLTQPSAKKPVQWVFALQWFALLQGPRSPALKLLLRRNQPQYLCFSGHTFHSVGLYYETLPKKVEAYSAALCVALSYPQQSWLFKLPLSTQEYWVLGIHEGAVVSGTDRLYGNAQEASAHIELLQQAYPHAQLSFQLPGASHVHEWLSEQSPLAARMQAHHRRTRYWSALGAAVLTVAIWSWRAGETVTPELSAHQLQQAQTIQAEFELGHALNGVAGLRQVLQVLGGLPLQPGGWQLQHSVCQPMPTLWQCAVKYHRDSPNSTNLSLEQAFASQVSVQFDTLDEATVLWRFEMNTQPLSQAVLQYRRRNERDLFSHLQSVQTAFTRLALSDARVIQPQFPPELEPATNEPPFLQRRWFSQGPMRSHYLLMPWVGAFRWEQVRLQWQATAQPSLQHSALTLTLEGYLYELADETKYSVHTSFSYPLLALDASVDS